MKLSCVAMPILLFVLSGTGRAEPITTPLAARAPRHPLGMAGLCTIGFEDARQAEASIEFDDPEAEASCDRRSVCGFKIAADIPCEDMIPGEGYESDMIQRYDLDRSGQVDCADYFTWKRWLGEQFRKGHRKTSGETLRVAECDDGQSSTLGASVARNEKR